jgi:hypothetical protein
VLVDDLVDLLHQTNSFAQGHDDPVVVGYVVFRKLVALAVLEPLLANLVAPNVEDLATRTCENSAVVLTRGVSITRLSCPKIDSQTGFDGVSRSEGE